MLTRPERMVLKRQHYYTWGSALPMPTEANAKCMLRVRWKGLVQKKINQR